MTRYVIACALLGLATSLASGCVAVYSMEDYPLRLVAGATGEPVEGAEVVVDYVGRRAINPPRTVRVVSDERGVAPPRVPDGQAWRLTVQAQGYVPLSYRAYGEALPGVERIEHEGQPVRQVGLFRKPEPRLTVVLPEGYRGVLLVDVQLDADALDTGQREFVARPNDAGYVRVDAPLVLWRALAPWPVEGMTVQYASGQIIERVWVFFDVDHQIIPGHNRAAPAEPPARLWSIGGKHNHIWDDDNGRVRAVYVIDTQGDYDSLNERYEAILEDEPSLLGQPALLKRLFELAEDGQDAPRP